MRAIDKAIAADCRRAMFGPWLATVVQESAASLLAVFAASLVAGLTDAVLALDIGAVAGRFWYLLACIAITVLVLPFSNYLCNALMLKRALVHDRLVLGRFLDKQHGRAMDIELGEAQYRLEDDPNAYRIGWMELLTKYAVTPITLAYLLYVALRMSWLYTLIVFGISLIKLIVPILVSKTNATYDSQSRDYATRVRALESQIVQRPHAAVTLGIGQALIAKLDGLFWHHERTVRAKSIPFHAATGFVSRLTGTLATLLVLLVGVVFVARGSLTPGAVAGMVGYFATINGIFGAIAHIVRETPVQKTLRERLRLLYSDAERRGGARVDAVARVAAEGLGFCYGDKEIFSGVDFDIVKGDKVAICGPNGSGKSTLLKLLCGLEDGYEGAILIDGVELSQVDLQSWRAHIAFATQEPYLFEDTVLENLTFDGFATCDEALAVLEQLGIAALAERAVKTQQNGLSGGEKQKLSVARALLKKTEWLLLDEPGNNLDADSQRWLADFIRSTDKTLIYISHHPRMTTLANKRIDLGQKA